MSELRFPILGTNVPRMLGRTKIMQRLWNDLTKPTPSNLSIVGPRYIGKTVLMKTLADRVRMESNPFQIVVYWHLGHVSPLADEDFVFQLCDELRTSLAAVPGQDYSAHRDCLTNHDFDFLKEVTDSLNSEGTAILMLWDGFDKPLGQGHLSGHLWDQMRAIFYGKRHKIVTATRRPLSELIRSEDAITSPFWNIFDMNPVRVEVFDEADREAVLSELSEISFQPGGKRELLNWTAGYPPLFLALLNEVHAAMPSGTADNETINAAAVRARDGVTSLIVDLWNDCSQSAKDLYRHLVDRGEILTADTGKVARSHLAEKGFVVPSGNKITKGCRLLEQHVTSLGPDAGILVRLFGSWEEYRTNIRGLLELRLTHLRTIDPRLRRLIEMSIENIPDYPDLCLTNVRNISDRALDLIWYAEFGSDHRIPPETLAYWERTLPEGRAVRLQDQFPDGKVPVSRGDQCSLLQILVGAVPKLESKAKRVSKTAYGLVNSVNHFGNLGQHIEGEAIHAGAAVAVIMNCLELAACLDRELKS